MVRPVQFLLGFFIMTLVMQFILWMHLTIFLDSRFWERRVVFLAHDIVHGPMLYNPARHTSHPSLPTLIPAAALYNLGLSTTVSLQLSVTLISALCITAIIAVLLQLRPYSLWPLAGAGLLFFNRLNDVINPADAIMMLLALLSYLLVLVIIEQKKNIYIDIFLGVIIGLAISTRTHIALPLLSPIFPLLIYTIGMMRTGTIFTITLASAIASNPLMWYMPIQYMNSVLFGEYTYSTGPVSLLSEIARVSNLDILQTFPIALCSILIACILLLQKNRRLPVSRHYLETLLLATGGMVVLLTISNTKSLRYYYPTMIIWELLFPLFIIHIIKDKRLLNIAIALFIFGNFIIFVSHFLQW